MHITWRLGKHRGHPCAVTGKGDDRKRIALRHYSPEDAAAYVRDLNLKAQRDALPEKLTIKQIYDLYEKDREKAKIVNLARVKEVGRTLNPIWGSLTVDDINKKEVERFIKARRDMGCTDGGIRNDLAYITAALNWAASDDEKLIPAAPKIKKPPAGRPRERWLTRDELLLLIDNAVMMHVKLFIILSIITAGRPKHVLELTWARVDLARRIINLDDPNRFKTQKGRARVPINETGFIHLETAAKVRTSDFVIEVDGRSIKSIRNGVKAAVRRAGLDGVSQYTLRHTAGVYMAQAGVPMEQIAEFMGHTSIETTRKHYARFHPDYLRGAASALEINFIRSTAGALVPPTVNETTPKDEEKQDLSLTSEA